MTTGLGYKLFLHFTTFTCPATTSVPRTCELSVAQWRPAQHRIVITADDEEEMKSSNMNYSGKTGSPGYFGLTLYYKQANLLASYLS